MGGVAFAQHPEGGRHHDGEQRLERSLIKAQERTDRMAERYGLSPEQKAQLLELNKKHEAGALRPTHRPFPGEMPPGQRPEGFRGERPPFDGGNGPQRPGQGMRPGDGPRPPFMGPDMEGPTQSDLKAEQKEYKKSLKRIMTKDQFKLYKKDVKNRKKARDARR